MHWTNSTFYALIKILKCNNKTKIFCSKTVKKHKIERLNWSSLIIIEQLNLLNDRSGSVDFQKIAEIFWITQKRKKQ